MPIGGEFEIFHIPLRLTVHCSKCGERSRVKTDVLPRTIPTFLLLRGRYDVHSPEPIRKMITPVGICPSNASRTVFEREGFLGPLPVLTTWQRELLVRHLNRGAHVAPAVWEKGRATSDYLFYDIATQPEILGILRLLLGENVILWGASVVSRQPGQIHPWHTDIETSRADMRSVSVWIGIRRWLSSSFSAPDATIRSAT